MRAFYALSASVVMWGVALLLLLLPDSGLNVQADVPAGFPLVLIAAGILFLLAFFSDISNPSNVMSEASSSRMYGGRYRFLLVISLR